MELTDRELIAAVLKGETASFEPLVKKYQSRIFAMAPKTSCKRSLSKPSKNSKVIERKRRSNTG